jgi:hypothetical protein
MKILEQLVALMTGLAWPITVLVLVRMFYRPISTLISNVRKVKAKDVEIDISREIQQAAALAAETKELVASPKQNLFDAWAPVRIAAISPAAAIIEAWKQIEMAGVRAIRRTLPDVQIESPNTSMHFARFLNARNLLSGTSVRVIDQLKMVRNRAAHDQEFVITKQELDEYLNTAVKIYVKLETIAQPSGAGDALLPA